MKRTRDESGFTLIEIIVVVAVAAIILPAILLPFVEGIRDLEKPVIRGTLAFLAQEEMERNIIPLGDLDGEYDTITGWAGGAISGFPGYYSSATVSFVTLTDLDTPVGYDTGYKRIEITITHGADSFSLVTVKTDYADDD